ncbi:hypothetical protein AB1N83_000218 [Pleurotus pulmonarius]
MGVSAFSLRLEDPSNLQSGARVLRLDAAESLRGLGMLVQVWQLSLWLWRCLTLGCCDAQTHPSNTGDQLNSKFRI